MVSDDDLHPGTQRPAQARGCRSAFMSLPLTAFSSPQWTINGKSAGLRQPTVEGIALCIGRVHAHRRQPFDGRGAVGDGQFQVIGGARPIGMQRRHPLKRREVPRQLGRPGVRDVESRVLDVGIALPPQTLEGKA